MFRCQKEFTSDTSEGTENPTKDERAKLLITWALENFQPSGPEPFEVIKGYIPKLFSFCVYD